MSGNGTRLAACAGFVLMGMALHGEGNLIRNFDFSASEDSKALTPECRCESGRISLFTEDATWNRCCKVEVVNSTPDKSKPGCLIHSAGVTIGYDAASKKYGFPVVPGVAYDLSVEIKGAVAGVIVDAVIWTGDSYWKDTRKIRIATARPNAGSWTVCKGTFRAPEGAKRASVRLAIWSSGRWAATPQYKVGDFFLVDNVSVERSRKNFDAAASSQTVRLRKVVSLGDKFDDFRFDKTGVAVPGEAGTEIAVRRSTDALVFDVFAREPGKLIVGDGPGGKVWSGDAIDLVFAGKDGRRAYSQFAFNAAGAQYTDAGGQVGNGDWSVSVNPVEGGWRAEATIPFAALGWSEPSGEIGFNVCRFRKADRSYSLWHPGKGNFKDPAELGRLLLDGYETAFFREFGKSEKIAGRADFEEKWLKAEEERLAAKFVRFKNAKAVAAVVPTVSDWTIPYLPEEIFDAPTSIVVQSAVNELKGVPVAIANLTDRLCDYRVVLETDENVEGGFFRGQFGLAGFPAEKIKVRKAVRVREDATATPGMRFDPLPEMDEVGSMTVGPKEAGLVWLDFDLRGVPAGAYKGRLRVIPLCDTCGPSVGSEAKAANYATAAAAYKGSMVTLPFTLEVEDLGLSGNAAPFSYGYCQNVGSESAFDAAVAIGADRFQVHAWTFIYELDAKGELDFSKPHRLMNDLGRTQIANCRKWAKKYGFKLKFDILYSAHNAAMRIYNGGNTLEGRRRAWDIYLKALRHFMDENGVKSEEYLLEIADEPKPDVMEELLEAAKVAKAQYPDLRLLITLGYHETDYAVLDRFLPYIDAWTLWYGRHGRKGERDFIKRARARGAEMFYYMCQTPIRNPVHSYYRLQPWHAWGDQIDGGMLYQFSEHIKGRMLGYRDFIDLPYGGVIYYGRGDSAVPSLRYMALREGFQDIRYFDALERLAGGDSDVRMFLDGASAKANGSTDARVPDRLREKMREFLRKAKVGK